MKMRGKKVSPVPSWSLHIVVYGLVALSAPAADSGMIEFQSAASSEAAQELVGHWRMTKVVFEEPKDEHLVLHADGTAENWVVTANSRSDPITGRWNEQGKTLTILLGEENEISLPFTFHEGQLVFPNIPNPRGFWERIE